MEYTKGEYPCRNCNGKVVYNEGYLSGWGHIIATGCVKPAVNINDWKRHLQEKGETKALAKAEEVINTP